MSRRSRSRPRDSASRQGIFGDQTPWTNPVAVYSYRSSVISMLPLAGLLFGPVAFFGGLFALYRYRIDPTVMGYPQARAAILIGTTASLFNYAGVACIWVGLTRV